MYLEVFAYEGWLTALTAQSRFGSPCRARDGGVGGQGIDQNEGKCVK